MAKQYNDADLSEWEQSVTDLRYGTGDSSDWGTADEATAMLCSGWGGYVDMPQPIANLVYRALETGYLTALSDAREGNIDGLGPVDE